MRAATFSLFLTPLRWKYFNPRCPCGQRLWVTCGCATHCKYFNPRCPCGQRQERSNDLHIQYDFNPRCPCGQRLTVDVLVLHQRSISIHAAHAGSDVTSYDKEIENTIFQSTLPMRAATPINRAIRNGVIISIHAAHAGSDNRGVQQIIDSDISIHAAHAGSDRGRQAAKTV